jgi:hypothetical protein
MSVFKRTDASDRVPTDSLGVSRIRHSGFFPDDPGAGFEIKLMGYRQCGDRKALCGVSKIRLLNTRAGSSDSFSTGSSPQADAVVSCSYCFSRNAIFAFVATMMAGVIVPQTLLS